MSVCVACINEDAGGKCCAFVTRCINATAFVRCRFYSQQDTLLPGGGYNWFYDCYVEGDTDFIWGETPTHACLKAAKSK